MTQPPDDLIERCIRGDKRAWDEFVERYSRLVFWAIKHRLSRFGFNFNEEDVNDIHQDVFFFIYSGRKLAQLKDRSKVSGWLAMVAGTRAAGYMRKMRTQRPPDAVSIYERIGSKDTEGFTLEETLAADAPDPQQEFDKPKIQETVERAINSLPGREKLILRLNLLHNKKHREIAEMLNISVNTVSSVISRSKEELSKRLEDIGIKFF